MGLTALKPVLPFEEVKKASDFDAGDLRHTFGAFAVNSPAFEAGPAPLRLVTENGHTLTTTAEKQSYEIEKKPFHVLNQDERDNFNYAVKALERGPQGVREPGPNTTTEIARIAPVVNTNATNELETKKREKEQEFLLLLQSIREDSEYLIALERRIREIDERLKDLAKEQEALDEAELELQEITYGDPSARQSAKARLTTSLRKLNMNLDDYTDSNGNIDKDRLAEDIRRRREEMDREERELRAEREDLATKYALAEQNRAQAKIENTEVLLKNLNLQPDQIEAIKSDTSGNALKSLFFETSEILKANSTVAKTYATPQDSDFMQDNTAKKQIANDIDTDINLLTPSSTKPIDRLSVAASAAHGSQPTNVITGNFNKASDGEAQTTIQREPTVTTTPAYSNQPRYG